MQKTGKGMMNMVKNRFWKSMQGSTTPFLSVSAEEKWKRRWSANCCPSKQKFSKARFQPKNVCKCNKKDEK